MRAILNRTSEKVQNHSYLKEKGEKIHSIDITLGHIILLSKEHKAILQNVPSPIVAFSDRTGSAMTGSCG